MRLRPLIVFFKANPWHDHLGRFARGPQGRGREGRRRHSGANDGPEWPDADTPVRARSTDIENEAEARNYWQAHFAGRRVPLNVRVGERVHRLQVYFDPANDHAFTVKDGGRQRRFSRARAAFMDRILSTISAPTHLRQHQKSKLFLARITDGQTHLVALTWDVQFGAFRFNSAYAITRKGLATKLRESEPTSLDDGTPLTKASGVLESDIPGMCVSRDGVNRFPQGAPRGQPASPSNETIVFLDEIFKALPPGARWITVHPNGKEQKGQPVLIQPSGDGAWRVIGGAGGKLNYLKLSGVRDAGDYKAEVAKKAAARAEEAKRRRAADREAGLDTAKKAAREDIRTQLRGHEAQFVATVGKALGWSDDDMRFPEEKFANASETARKKAAADHGRELYRRAAEAVDLQRRRLVADAEARSAADLGEVPLTTTAPDKLSVEDLAPVGNEALARAASPAAGGRARRSGASQDPIPAVGRSEGWYDAAGRRAVPSRSGRMRPSTGCFRARRSKPDEARDGGRAAWYPVRSSTRRAGRAQEEAPGVITTVAQFSVTLRRHLGGDGAPLGPLPDWAEPAALIPLYRAMVRTRAFDQKAVALQRTGRIGTYASALGQEAVGVGLAAAMRPEDVLLPSFREHAAQLWRGVTMRELLLYWGGDERGSDVAVPRGDFPVCVPVGGHAPHAAGVALAFRLRDEPRCAVCVLGDGATSKGDVAEALVFAGVWQLPLVVVVSNNQWAISLPRARQTAAATLAQKAIAAGIEGEQVDGNDVIAVRSAVAEALGRAREGGGPRVIEALTYRLSDHTTADDASRYRQDTEVSPHWAAEPLPRLRAYLHGVGAWSKAAEEELLAACHEEVEREVAAWAATPPQPEAAIFAYTYATMPDELRRQAAEAAS